MKSKIELTLQDYMLMLVNIKKQFQYILDITIIEKLTNTYGKLVRNLEITT